jgi:methionyl-tRNA formyltransferase
MAKLRIAFFGLPLAALLLARDGHEILFAAVSRKDAIGIRRARRLFGADRVWAKRPDIENSPALLKLVKSLKPDLLVSWFWTSLLPMDLMRAARLGGIGVHPSLLPRHRGPDPTFWAIAAGDTETGVTVHRLAEQYDTGDILAVEKLAIDPSWNAWELARALDRPSLRQLRATVARFARRERVAGEPQDPALATEAPTPNDEMCALRWAWPTEQIIRHVRALAPAPGAWTEISGRLVTVLRAAPATAFPAALQPGEGAIVAGLPIVRTGDSAVVLVECEIDGEPASRADLEALFHEP